MEEYSLYWLEGAGDFILKNRNGRKVITKEIKDCVRYLFEMHQSHSDFELIFPPTRVVQRRGVACCYRALTDRQQALFWRMWHVVTRKK